MLDETGETTAGGVLEATRVVVEARRVLSMTAPLETGRLEARPVLPITVLLETRLLVETRLVVETRPVLKARPAEETRPLLPMTVPFTIGLTEPTAVPAGARPVVRKVVRIGLTAVPIGARVLFLRTVGAAKTGIMDAGFPTTLLMMHPPGGQLLIVIQPLTVTEIFWPLMKMLVGEGQ